MNQCFVCGKHLQRCDINNDFSREDFTTTVRKIIGDDYVLIFGEEDHLCCACQNLLLRIIRLDLEETNNILAMGVLLQMKYSLDVPDKSPYVKEENDEEEPCQKTIQSDNETEHCFVCDKLLQGSDFNTDYSRSDLIQIIRKIVGDKYFMVIKEEDHLCQACQDLMSKIQSKSAELRTMTLAMRALLRIKYSLDFDGVLGSGLEDSSAITFKKPAPTLKDFPALSFKRPVKKTCSTKRTKSHSVRGNKSNNSVTSPIILPSTTDDVCTLEQPVLKKRNKSLGVSLLKTEFNNLNSSEGLVSDIKVEKTSVNNTSSAAIETSSQPKTYEYGFDKSGRKKCLERKVPKPFKCGRCKFKYSTPEELESHNLEMKSVKDLYCKICDFSFHLKNLLNQHNSYHSPFNLKRHCKLCNQPIYDRLHLRYHMFTIHNGEEVHKCSQCSRSFLWKRQLTTHIFRRHERRPAFICEKCNKVYGDEVKYKKHVEYFHRSSYCCKICVKSFKNIDSLSLHEKSHRKIITYKCQYCFKKYRTEENRRLHEEQHTGNFQYKCDNCGLGFEELFWFENHKAKNTCARTLYGYINHPTMCEICGKIFSNRHSFKDHHLLHYNPQPFECDICFKKLRYKGKLLKHKKRYHPESLDSTSANQSV